MPLLHRQIQRLRRDDRQRRFGFVVLLQLGGKVNRIADHGIFQPVRIADRPHHHPSGGQTRVHHQRHRSRLPPLRVPPVRLRQQVLHGAHRIGGESGAWRQRPEGRHDAVAHELVDHAAMPADLRGDPRLVFRQQADDVSRRHFGRQSGEPPQIDHQDGGIPGLPLPRQYPLFRGGDPVGDFRREEPRQIARLRPFRHGRHQQMTRPPQGQRQDAGDQHDGQHLVDFGADQDLVAGEVFHIVAGQHAVERIDGHGVGHHPAPPAAATSPAVSTKRGSNRKARSAMKMKT